MSEQWPGGFITKTPPTPQGAYETSSAYGIWNLSQQAGYQKQGLWPVPGNQVPDPQFNYVTMLLHGDGTNGAQNNTFLDSSSNAFTITRNGNTTQGSFSPYGSNWSNYFDGSGDYFTVPNDSDLQFSTQAFTMEAFIFPTASVYGCIASKGNYPSTGYFEFRTNTSNKIDFYDSNLGASITSTATINLNQWNHVAVCRSGTTITLYINGLSSGSATDGGDFSNTGTFAIGAASQGGSYTNFFTGYISNFRLVKGTAVYTTSPYTVPTAPLTAIANAYLLTCQSNRFIDNGTHPNFTLTKNGDISVQRFSPFGASTAYSTSTIGGSGYFDGTGDYLSVANNAAFQFGTGDFTVEFWLYNTGTLKGFIAMNGTSGGSWAAVISGGYLYWQTNTATSNLYSNSASSLAANAWNHVAIVRSSGTNKMYFNGSVQATTAADSTNYASTASLYVGLWPGAIGGGSNDYFTGYLSDVRINKGTAIYTGAFTPPTLAPLATSGASSAVCYPSTTNVNTSFAASTTSLLTSMTNGAIYDNAMMNDLETVGNAQISTSVKKYGTGSLYFDGTGDWLTTANSQSLIFGSGNWTMECWGYLTDTSGVRTLAAKGYGLSGGFLWWVQSGDLRIRLYDTGGGQVNIVATAVISANTWYHIAAVRSGNTVTMYVNGTSVASGTFTSSLTATSVFEIGTYDAGSGSYIGYIDDFRITKGYARYTTTFTPPTAAFPNVGPN